MDLEKIINNYLLLKSNTKNLQADSQEFMTKLLHEIHVNDLLSSEVNILPDYICKLLLLLLLLINYYYYYY